MTGRAEADTSHVSRANIAANVAYHAALAAEYDATQPHLRPENVERVTGILRQLAEESGGGTLVDLGCGTGFVTNIARRFFRHVVGVDVTWAMLERVDRSSGNVELVLASTDGVPLADGTFDACTAYAHLHHLSDLAPVLREAARLLRPGGRFYSDQDPNQRYWAHLKPLRDRAGLDDFVAREVEAVVEVVDVLAHEMNLTPDQIALAEYQEMHRGGLRAEQMVETLLQAGFEVAAHRYEWFLGQGVVLHQDGAAGAEAVEAYLRRALPASEHFFKYVSLFATR